MTKQYAVIFYQGDEAFSGLLEFAEKYHVTSAHFTAIGALSGATLGWFDPQRKMYKKIPINGQHEVIGMSGAHAARQFFRDWETEVAGRIAAIRAERTGEGVTLTPQQARALAGESYAWLSQGTR